MKQQKINEIIDFVQNDTRSKDEIFESLKQQIQDDHNGQLSEEEAVDATRRLIGLFELFSDMYDDKKRRELQED
ncbi:MAG: hypothetical protein H6908_05355 [Hyphomicrobiales bacterium]|nr:hypothetical protein [Hyphomicrobiales bacterium]